MARLTDAMPPPRGVDPAKAVDAYTKALVAYDIAEIEEGIDRYLRGECDEKISLKFYPRPPEMGKIVRMVRLERTAELEKAKRAERLAAERAEVEAGLELRVKTPEQKRRADEIVARYRRGEPVNANVAMPSSFKAARWADKPDEKSPGRRTASVIAEEQAAESARIREAYGMTDELVSKMRDSRPLPPGMRQAGAALPALPAPAAAVEDLSPDAMLSDEEIERRFGSAS